VPDTPDIRAGKQGVSEAANRRVGLVNFSGRGQTPPMSTNGPAIAGIASRLGSAATWCGCATATA